MLYLYLCYILSMFDKTDEEIIELYKSGEKEIFKHLINRYTSSIFNFTVRLTNKNDAPDIVQDTFIKAWKNIKKFDFKKASFKTWIFTIARNTTIDSLRKKKSILFSEILDLEKDETFADNIPDENLLPDEALQKLEDTETLNMALEKLNPKYKEILILHYQEEMTFKEIGYILNKPLNTIKSIHHRTIKELKKILLN